jgi:Transposase DDE domain
VRNITDPDSRLMPVRGGGFLQGYNTQNMTSEDELIIATELTDDPVDFAWFEPMTSKAGQAAALIEAHRPASPAPEPGPASPAPEPGPASPAPEPGPASPGGGGTGGGIGLVLADAGYCSEDNLTSPGPDRLIATGKGRDLEKAARAPDSQDPGRGGPATQAMRERLKTPDGIAAYRQRGHIAETPHGHIKHNMGLRQLSVRGKRKASAEWEFICAVHNLFKALSTGHLTGHALAALPS